jgi:hypothetical protein
MSLSEMESPNRVANDVGPAIIGPMRRRKDGRWDWHTQSRRSLEAAVASWVIDLLEKEGHRIDDLWSPDYDRARRPELQSRPELAMTIDGEPAALDVTMFTTNLASAAAARASRIRKSLEAQVAEAAGGRSALGLVVYREEALNGVSRRELITQTASLGTAYVAAVEAIQDTSDRQVVQVPYSWVKGASLTLARDGLDRGRTRIHLIPSRPDMASHADTFVAELLASKGAQLAAWGRGIVVVVHGFRETPEDVAAGFARGPSLPWWRVYWVGPSPDHIHLVAS